MISELTLMQLASSQKKLQVHDQPLFPCSAYYTSWRRGLIEGVPWHWHGELEFMTVAEGEVLVEFGAEIAELQAGDGYFCNTGALHRIALLRCDRGRVHSIVVDAGLIAGGEGSIFDRKYIQPITMSPSFSGMVMREKERAQAGMLEQMRAAFEACRAEPEGYEYDVRYHLGKALVMILEENRNNLDDPLPRDDTDRERLRRMLECIRRRYAEKLTICDLASEAGICGREAQRCFQRILRQTPADYLQMYRLQMACQQLLDTDLSVLDIGMSCGFSNPSHFSRVFRQHTGHTPREYRRLLAAREA